MRPPQNTPRTTPRLRIIAGQWRGRKLPILDAEGLRPTGDRLRETLFNWLGPHVPGAHCLDLFAGSGALGFEALSRGAASATMLEVQRDVAAQLRANCATLGAKHADVLETSALAWLQHNAGRQFDVVFIDPPFDANLWQSTIDALEAQKLLADEARIYIEAPKQLDLLTPPTWMPSRRKAAGAVCAHLFIRTAAEDSGPINE